MWIFANAISVISDVNDVSHIISLMYLASVQLCVGCGHYMIQLRVPNGLMFQYFLIMNGQIYIVLLMLFNNSNPFCLDMILKVR